MQKHIHECKETGPDFDSSPHPHQPPNLQSTRQISKAHRVSFGGERGTAGGGGGRQNLDVSSPPARTETFPRA